MGKIGIGKIDMGKIGTLKMGVDLMPYTIQRDVIFLWFVINGTVE